VPSPPPYSLGRKGLARYISHFIDAAIKYGERCKSKRTETHTFPGYSVTKVLNADGIKLTLEVEHTVDTVGAEITFAQNGMKTVYSKTDAGYTRNGCGCGPTCPSKASCGCDKVYSTEEIAAEIAGKIVQ